MHVGRAILQPSWYIFAFFILLTACQNPLQAPGTTNYFQTPEPTYCGSASAKSYSGSVTNVSGTAVFYYRALQTSGCTGLCGDPVSLGIPFGELHIEDSSGNTIQCAETDASGVFTNLQIPQTAGTYKIKAYSRSQTSKVKASVLQDIYSGLPYIVEKSFTVTAGQTSVTGVTVSAYARTSEDSLVSGGAFNIMADIYWANQFLRANTGNTSFVADKVSVYWKAGFNPYAYYNAPSSLASFYVASEDRLYILGGKNGDVKNSDTDHFDDSVILHEYGHFLEAHYGHSDSPGGSHNGDFIIDPRLAWSEGWANYFQGAVLDNVVYAASTGPKGTSGFTAYVDTIGFKNDSVEGTGASASIAINRSLTEAASSASFDRPGTNEGVFREFSISRTLFKTLKTYSVPFTPVWQAFTALNDQTTVYTPARKFVNFGLFNSILNTKITDSTQNTNWTSVLTEEKQKKTVALYANTLGTAAPVSNACAASAVSMYPAVDGTYTYSRSNQLMSNDFYIYYHDGSSKKINFVSSTGLESGYPNVIDMNLYLYSDGYNYSEEIQENSSGFSNFTLLRRSKTLNVSNNSETESVDLTGLAPGYYMINPKAATLNKTSANLSNGSASYYLYIGTTSTVTTCLVPQY